MVPMAPCQPIHDYLCYFSWSLDQSNHFRISFAQVNSPWALVPPATATLPHESPLDNHTEMAPSLPQKPSELPVRKKLGAGARSNCDIVKNVQPEKNAVFLQVKGWVNQPQDETNGQQTYVGTVYPILVMITTSVCNANWHLWQDANKLRQGQM